MVATTLGSLAFAAPAPATTFCVPSFHPACPNSGGRVAQASLATAMQTNGSDGIADTAVIDAVTITNPESILAAGEDPLTVRGAGPAATRVTLSSNINEVVLDLATGNDREIRVAELTIAIPESAPDDGGGGVQLKGDTLENVDIVSRNPGLLIGSPAIANWVGGGTFRGGEIRTEDGGDLSVGVGSTVASGEMVVAGAAIHDAAVGIDGSSQNATITVRRSEVTNPAQVGVLVSRGALTIENSSITTNGHSALVATANSANPTSLTADHVTAVNSGIAPIFGVQSTVQPGQAGNANTTVSNSIVRGYASTFLRAVGGGATGDANLTIRYSNAPATGTSSGDGTLDIDEENIDADPLFASATDFRLQAGSPSIDAADPASTLTSDLAGAPRPVDGDDDGLARADQGAFEFQPPEANLGLTLRPMKKEVKAGRSARFRATARNTGNTAASGVEVCMKAQKARRGLRPRQRKCETVGPLAAAAQVTKRFTVRTKAKAAGKRFEIKFTASGAGLRTVTRQAKLIVRDG